jgi:hypothetical protein
MKTLVVGDYVEPVILPAIVPIVFREDLCRRVVECLSYGQCQIKFCLEGDEIMDRSFSPVNSLFRSVVSFGNPWLNVYANYKSHRL